MLMVPAVVLALSFHEYSHARIAYALGDPTAKVMGRMTINPLKHLDQLGTLCMLIVGYGWAKPVPIDPRRFKNPKKGMALFKRRFRTFVAENILRPMLGVRSTRKILADRRERIYPNSHYVEKLMRDFYGDFNSTIFYPPTTFAPGADVPRDPLRVICLGQIFPEKRVAEMIGIVKDRSLASSTSPAYPKIGFVSKPQFRSRLYTKINALLGKEGKDV